jgi:hypothetical protein
VPARYAHSAHTGQHLRTRPPVKLHQVALGPASVEKRVVEVTPELVRINLNASLQAAPLDI